MSEDRKAEVWAQAHNFIVYELLQRDPEYLDVAEYLDDEWVGEDELDDELIAEVYQEVARQMSIASTLFSRWEE